jgi:signal transduction histidine kinase/FixJ family two-component response regulator
MKLGPGGLPSTDMRRAWGLGAIDALLTCGLVFGVSLLAINSAWLSGGVLVVWPADGLILGLMLAPTMKRPWIVMGAGLVGALLAFCIVGRQMVFGISRIGMMAVAIPIAYLVFRRALGGRSIAEGGVLLPFMTACAAIGVATAFVRAVIVDQFTAIPLVPYALTSAAATFVGLAVITPLILLVTQPRPESVLSPIARLKMWSIIAVYIGAMTAAFLEPRYPAAYLVPLALILVAHVVDFTGIVVVILATAFISAGLTLLGHGPIAHFTGDTKDKITFLQTFLAVVICTTLPFSALKNDRERLARSLIAALDAAKAASRTKSTFLATMSHEIRTPLNGVLGMAQAIELDELTPAQRERVAVVRSSGEALLALLNDILDLSKVEAGELTLEMIPFEPTRVVGAVVAQNKALAEKKGLSLQSDTLGLEGAYIGDPNRLRQILQNLVSNAIKFTEAGGVTIVARAEDDGLTFRVCDTGMGIASQQLGLLFEKFRQLDESITRRFGGTGLGLSICRELAQAMGGDVAVESRIGLGSTFILTVPLQRSTEAVAATTTEDDCPPQDLALRVLAAEDNATNQLVLRTLLGAVGIVPTLVDNGAEAVAAWRDGDWDIILMDIQMPVMDGLTATKEIRRQEAADGRAHTPIVALTANVMDHHVREYLAIGMDDCLAKPISADKLFALLATLQSAQDQEPTSQAPAASLALAAEL